MKPKELSRRDLIKTTLGAGLWWAGPGRVRAATPVTPSVPNPDYDAKGLPTAGLGKTGIRIPRIGLGLGSRFCTIEKEEEAQTLLNHALDQGLYYWDTACIYENAKLRITSEGRAGEVLKSRRKEVFLSTKVTSREPDEALRQIETSLKRLQTDHLDLLKIHDVQSDQDVARISARGNLIDIVHRMKEQGLTRFIGFSGHADASALTTLAERGDFDSMLIALNHYKQATNPQLRFERAIPAARNQGLGVVLMKVVRPRETVAGLDPKELVRFGLSLKGPDAIVLGMDSMAVMESNLDLLRHFQPLEERRMKELAMQLTPFYRHTDLPWMRSGYCDGRWA